MLLETVSSRRVALAEAQGQIATAIRCLRNLGSVANRAGDYDAALTSMRQAQTRAREAGLAFAEADALLAQAGPHLGRADWAGAERVLRQALQLAATLGARQLMLNGLCMRGCVLIELGRLDEARAELNKVRTEGAALGQAQAVMYADTLPGAGGCARRTSRRSRAGAARRGRACP